MKKINKKTIFFAILLISVSFLMLIFSFAVITTLGKKDIVKQPATAVKELRPLVVPGRMIVKYRKPTGIGEARKAELQANSRLHNILIGEGKIVEIANFKLINAHYVGIGDKSIIESIRELKERDVGDLIEYIVPVHKIYLDPKESGREGLPASSLSSPAEGTSESGLPLPDDSYLLDYQWGLENFGQDMYDPYDGVDGYGTRDADIDAPEAWDIRSDTGSEVIVAIIDTGVDYTHEDLIDNMWIGPDGEYGYDFVNDDTDPMDEDAGDYTGHGTHVAGIIGAVGDNGLGITGICQNTQIMALKVFGSDGAATDIDIISAIQYLIDYANNNPDKKIIANLSLSRDALYYVNYDTDDSIVNPEDVPYYEGIEWDEYNEYDSSNPVIYGLEEYPSGLIISSSAVYDAMEEAGDAGILCVVSAGNSGLDGGSNFVFPANFDLDNIITVAASNYDDNLADIDVNGDFSSNYGPNIDLAAPGVRILSTMSGSYYFMGGTSMAAPFVTGACALVWAQDPSLTYRQVIDIILNPRDFIADSGLVVSDRRLNVYEALLDAGGTPSSDTATPENLIIHSVGNGEVTVNCNASEEPDIDKYNFYKKQGTDDYSFDGESDHSVIAEHLGVVSYTYSGLANGVEYTFVATAVYDDGYESSYSNPVRATPLAPSAPILHVNEPPLLNPIGNKTVNEGDRLSFTISAIDPEAGELTFSALMFLSMGASFNPATRAFTWTPGYDKAGEHTVTFTVTDNGELTDSESVTITVRDVTAPGQSDISIARTSSGVLPITSSLPNITVSGGDTGSQTFYIINSGTLPLGFNISASASWLSSSPSFGAIAQDSNREINMVYDSTGLSAGAYICFVTITSDDPDTPQIKLTAHLVVNPTEEDWIASISEPPTANAGDGQTVNEGDTVTLNGSGSDPDGDTLTYSWSQTGGTNVTLSSNTTVSPTFTAPEVTDPMNLKFSLTVSDGELTSDPHTVTITVNNVNREPILEPIGNKSVSEGNNLRFTISATDPDGDSLTYSITGKPSGATLNSSTGAFTWTPGYTQAGTYNVTFTATDKEGMKDSKSATITVNNVNRKPVLNSIGNKSVNEKNNLRFTISANDPDEDSLTYSITRKPSGATLNSSTGAFTWTPRYTQAGTYNVTFTATDKGGKKDSKSVTIKVNNVNRKPTANAGSDKTVNEHSTVKLSGSGSDPDRDNLTYSWKQTSGSSVTLKNAATKNPTFTAPEVTATTSLVFRLTVSDGSKTASDNATIKVKNVNRKPKIYISCTRPINRRKVGKSITVYRGERVRMYISAKDPDKDSVKIYCTKKPSGSRFKRLKKWKGRFTWKPKRHKRNRTYRVTFKTNDGSVTKTRSIYIRVKRARRPRRK